jgi:hypothetical protein
MGDFTRPFPAPMERTRIRGVAIPSAVKAIWLKMVTYGLKAVPFCALCFELSFRPQRERRKRSSGCAHRFRPSFPLGQGKGKKRGILSTSAVVRAFG